MSQFMSHEYPLLDRVARWVWKVSRGAVGGLVRCFSSVGYERSVRADQHLPFHLAHLAGPTPTWQVQQPHLAGPTPTTWGSPYPIPAEMV